MDVGEECVSACVGADGYINTQKYIINKYNQYIYGTTSSEGLRTDISVRGVYESQVEASLDIRVTDTDAESFKLKSVLQVLKTHETEKKRKYKKACDERR